MKGKTFYALLLSLVMVAGAMTINDAFAQTNTERLITVIGTTDDTNQKVTQLESLWENFGSMFTPITDALDELAGDVAMISSDVDELSGDVMGISASVDNLEAKLAELESTSEMNEQYHADHVAALSEGLPSLQEKIDTVSQDINIDQIINKIDAISTQVNSFSDELSTLQGDVESIQEELGLVKQTAVVTTGTPPSDLNKATESADVMLSWYTRGLTEVPDDNMYKAMYYFSCESDVFVGKVSSTIGKEVVELVSNTNTVTTDNKMMVKYNPDNTKAEVPNPIYTRLNPGATTDTDLRQFDAGSTDHLFRTTLSVNDETLFNTHFTGTIGTTPPVEYDNVADFELMELKTGQKLTFISTSMDPHPHTDDVRPLTAYVETKMNTANATEITLGDANTIGDEDLTPLTPTVEGIPNAVTKAQLGAGVVYSVDVEYYSESDDAKCMITPGETMLNKVDQSLSFGIAPSDNNLISSYMATVACDLNRVKITDVVAELTADPGFNVHVNMDFKIGDDTKAKFTFDENNKAVLEDPDSLPIDFAGTHLTVSGNIVSGASAIVQITYDTVMGGECTAQ